VQQRARRASERAVRRAAVAFRRWAARFGLTLAAAAARLGLPPRTLARWQRRWQTARLRPKAHGRPSQRSPRALRERLLALLGLLGPGAGLPTLLALCPGLARREVQDLLRRYRAVWRRSHRRLLRVLHWQGAGRVWATDFAQPPLSVEGRYGRMLAVRDLASGFQLAWLPVADETAATAADALLALFHQYGPPLVLKFDNGSAFIAEQTQVLLVAWEVWPLPSPPDLPEYNGACEAGIGSMKTRTHHQAARSGRPGEWTCDDAEAARLEANETARPWGHRGPTPAEVWQQRQPIRDAERAAFGATVRRMQDEERRRRQAEVPAQPGRQALAALQRAALPRALIAHGILRFTSERVSPRLPG
jgi:hypothetical protein